MARGNISTCVVSNTLTVFLKIWKIKWSHLCISILCTFYQIYSTHSTKTRLICRKYFAKCTDPTQPLRFLWFFNICSRALFQINFLQTYDQSRIVSDIFTKSYNVFLPIVVHLWKRMCHYLLPIAGCSSFVYKQGSDKQGLKAPYTTCETVRNVCYNSIKSEYRRYIGLGFGWDTSDPIVVMRPVIKAINNNTVCYHFTNTLSAGFEEANPNLNAIHWWYSLSVEL